MKKILTTLSFLMAMFIFSSCNSDEKYKEQAKVVLQDVNAVMLIAEANCESYISIWNGVIWDKYYNGEYCSDFNFALSKEAEKREKLGLTSNKEMARLKKHFEAIKDVPKSCKEMNNELISIYVAVQEYQKLSETPEGSLKSYNATTDDLLKQINNKVSTFKIKYKL